MHLAQNKFRSLCHEVTAAACDEALVDLLVTRFRQALQSKQVLLEEAKDFGSLDSCFLDF